MEERKEGGREGGRSKVGVRELEGRTVGGGRWKDGGRVERGEGGREGGRREGGRAGGRAEGGRKGGRGEEEGIIVRELEGRKVGGGRRRGGEREEGGREEGR